MKNRLMAAVLSAVLISGCVSIPVLANEDMTEMAFDSIDEADAQELTVEDDSSELDFADIEQWKRIRRRKLVQKVQKRKAL